MPSNLHSPLLPSVSQHEVDFVIPRVGTDLEIGIDPFLLYKSNDPTLANLHSLMLSAFNGGLNALNENNEKKAYEVFDFPEVEEIGMGYSHKSKKGRGIGRYLSALIVETLQDAPLLRERGIQHIEEMQLISVGIGADRISDISANLLKQYLISYTQKQCALWDITLTKGVPISHVFDFDTKDWYDGYFDLPLSPINNSPMLFVPRRIVRVLPWINYNDYFRQQFSAYLRAKNVRAKLNPKKEPRPPKQIVVNISRKEVEQIEAYIKVKEAHAANAQPSLSYIDDSTTCPQAEELTTKLSSIKVGTKDASKYQRLVLEILNFLFNPEFIDGRLEVRTIDGTERRDIIFTNDSDKTFWNYVRLEHSSLFVMFETKNTASAEIEHINQVASYLGDRLGRLGFIVTRNALAIL